MVYDRAYAEWTGGRYELHTYSEGQKVVIMTTTDAGRIERYCKKHGYKLTWVGRA